MIRQIIDEKDAKVCDKLLEKLITDEKQYDTTIEGKIIINNYFNRVIQNKNNILLGYYDNEIIVGYIFIKKQNENVCLLDGLYVEPNYRNKGIASSLINESINICKRLNCKYIDINVLYQNEVAKHIYKKLEFNEFKLTMRREIN